MKRKPMWSKLYLFAVVSCVVLFLLPPTNKPALMLWTIVMFGGIWVWLMANQSQLTETSACEYTVVTRPVAEFFDDDRVLMQQNSSKIPDDSVQNSPHEVV